MSSEFPVLVMFCPGWKLMGTMLVATREAMIDIMNAEMIQITTPTITLVVVLFETVDKKMAMP